MALALDPRKPEESTLPPSGTPSPRHGNAAGLSALGEPGAPLHGPLGWKAKLGLWGRQCQREGEDHVPCGSAPTLPGPVLVEHHILPVSCGSHLATARTDFSTFV